MKFVDKTNMSEEQKQYIRKQVEEGRNVDRLSELFKMQHELDQYIFEQHRDKLPTTLSEWVLQYIHCISDELSEIRGEVNWKHWKAPKQIDVDKLREEVSDVWFFLIALTQRVGMSADDIFQVYEKKREENFARQRGESRDGSAYDYRNKE